MDLTCAWQINRYRRERVSLWVMRLNAIWEASEEYWIGIIDATYGIIQTLLVIELPIVILKTIENQKPQSQLIIGMEIGVTIIGYFAIFTIIYDIWLHHKVLLYDINKNRVFILLTGWILFASSLVPPIYYLVNHYDLEALMGEHRHDSAMTFASIAIFGIITIVYLFSAVIAKLGKRQLGLTPEKREELEFIFGTSSTKALITAFIGVIGLSPLTYMQPPIGIAAIAIITYFPINFFKKRHRR